MMIKLILGIKNLREKRILDKEADEYIKFHFVKAERYYTPNDLLQFGLDCIGIKGSYLEFGVYKGGSITFMAEATYEGKRIGRLNLLSDVSNTPKIYGFDSFEGLRESEGSPWPTKKFDLKGISPEVPPNVVLYKGYFEDTLPMFLKENDEDVAFLHLDCSVYSSYKTVFGLLAPRIKSGTIIVLNTYFNYPNWKKHAYKAFQEFGRKYKYIGYRRGYDRGKDEGGVCVLMLPEIMESLR